MQEGLPEDNYSLILDLPPQQPEPRLRLIETNNHLPVPSLLSLASLDKPHPVTEPLLSTPAAPHFEEQDSLGATLLEPQPSFSLPTAAPVQPAPRKKKAGCTCKKTNCVKMYCQCFAVGRECTAECACVGCHNHADHSHGAKPRPSQTNRHTTRGCNCRKTQCVKKYCECFNAGLQCGAHCNCSDCHNHGHEEEESAARGE